MKGCEFMSLNGGYAMIKYNSTQDELQIAYRSKKPALFYDENQRAHWAVIEETAKESIDEETQEQITIYEYSYRLLNDIEALVDRNGNQRFIVGNGTAKVVSGMSLASIKWSLNGSNLMFEILGTFSLNLRGFDILCTFDLPDWVADKIIIAYNDIVDFIDYNITTTSGSVYKNKMQITKSGNTLYFTNIDNTTNINGLSLFKIRYNIIIDNE